MAIKIVIGQELINVISAYAPQVGLDTSLKEKFWEELGDLVQGIGQTEKIFIGGDLNGHVGKETGNNGVVVVMVLGREKRMGSHLGFCNGI